MYPVKSGIGWVMSKRKQNHKNFHRKDFAPKAKQVNKLKKSLRPIYLPQDWHQQPNPTQPNPTQPNELFYAG